MYKHGKTDANQSRLIDFIRGIGGEAQSLASMGGGVPDLLVAYRGQWFLLEVKDDGKPPSKRKLTPDEQAWHDRFGDYAPVYVVENEDDVARALGVSIT